MAVISDRFSGSLIAVGLMAAAVSCQGRGAPEPPDESHATSESARAVASATAARHVRVEAAPEGEVATLVQQWLTRGRAEGRSVLVYVGAAWCEPCRRFHEAALRGDLDATFGDLTLLEFDLDRDDARLRAAGYRSRYIPLFAVPSADGTASGRQIEGSIKGEGAVDNIKPRLAALLRP